MTLAIGSRSHGTLKREDLAQAICDMFAEARHDLDEIAYDSDADFVAAWLAHYSDHEEPCNGTTAGVHFRQCPLSGYDGHSTFGIDEAIDGAIDMLNEYAPIYCYVGMIEGDGSDFGVWPDHDAIQEAIENGEIDPEDSETAINVEDGVRIHVSDHGNVEIYSLATGESLLAIV